MELTLEQRKALAIASAKAKAAAAMSQQAMAAQGPQMGAIPEGSKFTPDPLDTGEPSFMQSLLEPGLQAPKDVLYSTAASAAVPTLAVPKFLSSLPGVLQGAIKAAPQVTAAGTGGGLGRATKDQGFADKPLSELIADYQTGFKEFAGAEAAGLGIAGAVSKVFSKAFPGASKEATNAINYARENNIPIPSAALKEPGKKGIGAPLHKVSEQTFLGDFVRRTQANKINDFIELESRRLASELQTIDATAQNVSGFITDVFKQAENAKDVAYNSIKAKIPVDYMIKADATYFAAGKALDSLARQGLQKSPLGKRLSDMLETTARNKTFDNLDQLRKVANKALRKSESHEAAKLFIDGIDSDLNTVGKEFNFNLLDEQSKAAEEMRKLTALKKIPGLKRFGDMKNAQGYVRSFVNETNLPALNYLEKNNKEMYTNLVNARLKQILDDSVTKDGVFDGGKLLNYLNDHRKFMIDTYGQSFEAIENFAKYTKFVKDELKHLTKDDQFMRLFASGGLGGAGLVSGGGLAPLIATEATTAFLTSKLTNPKSAIFKVFTESTPQGVNKAMTTALPSAFRLSATGGGYEQ